MIFLCPPVSCFHFHRPFPFFLMTYTDKKPRLHTPLTVTRKLKCPKSYKGKPKRYEVNSIIDKNTYNVFIWAYGRVRAASHYYIARVSESNWNRCHKFAVKFALNNVNELLVSGRLWCYNSPDKVTYTWWNLFKQWNSL